MTEMQNPYASDATAAMEAPGTSKLAISGLVCSLIFCCPCTTIIGPILGLIALFTAAKGKGIAIAAIVLGVVFTAAQFGAGAWVNTTFNAPMREGPRAAFTAGFNGDANGFRAAFFGDVAQASDEEVDAFFAELRDRYGDFVTMNFDDATMQANPPAMEDMMQPIQTYPYRIEFANGTVDARIEFTMVHPVTQEWTQFGTIRIIDADRGDLFFPAPPSDSGDAEPAPEASTDETDETGDGG